MGIWCLTGIFTAFLAMPPRHPLCTRFDYQGSVKNRMWGYLYFEGEITGRFRKEAKLKKAILARSRQLRFPSHHHCLVLKYFKAELLLMRSRFIHDLFPKYEWTDRLTPLPNQN